MIFRLAFPVPLTRTAVSAPLSRPISTPNSTHAFFGFDLLYGPADGPGQALDRRLDFSEIEQGVEIDDFDLGASQWVVSM